MNLESLIGQKLDGKYLIERELGRGGMGAVYLALHIGTERVVALKVIVPQFMQRIEFVERFRREARAAGRLRHPNVVDVTDFGFADIPEGRVAYLVMEYLDGCTLGEILEEEKQLPLAWTLDILEQVSSAVNEAHEQGIIHRDLKPDNIWLEPNQRGGYTVKVLDFGIAKLEESFDEDTNNADTAEANEKLLIDAKETIAIHSENTSTKETSNFIREAGTIIKQDDKGTILMPLAELSSEDGTAILSNKSTQIIQNEAGTKILSQALVNEKEISGMASASLTRVGAVLGTPLYMSPEQCRGERLTSSSDIYSMAVIAYQMLAGKTPFSGDFTSVMEAHKTIAPPPLDQTKIPKKVKKVLFAALEKDPAKRPGSAEAFASELRSHSEGIGVLLQKALIIFSEHLPQFLILAVALYVPVAFFQVLKIAFGLLASLEFIDSKLGRILDSVTAFIGFFVQVVSIAVMGGVVTLMIAQLLAFPLREIDLRKTLRDVWGKKRKLFPAVTAATLLALVFTICCFPFGIYFSTVYMLITPSIILEDLQGKVAFRRSKQLVSRSFLTGLALSAILFFVPAVISATIGGAAAVIAHQIDFIKSDEPTTNSKTTNSETPSVKDTDTDTGGTNISINGAKISIDDNNRGNLTGEELKARRLRGIRRDTFAEIIVALFMLPLMALLSSFASVLTALMYFKTRLAGGESMQDLIEKFEESEDKKSNWQKRAKERLNQSGRVGSTERK